MKNTLRVTLFCMLSILLTGQDQAEAWDGPKQYIVLSTSDVYDGSPRNGKPKPSGYQIVHETYGSFEGKEIAIGVAPMFRVFQRDLPVFAAQIRNHLKQSEQYEVPIFICLSSFVMNEARPDIWNWWDPDAPGFNPDNVNNVEWSGWTAGSAVKIGWLNWGSQMRLKPMPNLMSPVFRSELKTAFDTLGGIVKEWYDELPEDKKWLLIGFRTTDEVAIGINNWYYPNGNAYLDADPADDPRTGLDPLDLPSRGVQTIGYNAVQTAGIKNSGTITIEDLNEICRRHCEYCSRLIHDLGFPREKIYSSSFGKTEGECKTCLTDFSCPSWSFYHATAANPDKFEAAFAALEHSDAPAWAMAEWGIPKNAETEKYVTGLSKGLSIPRCRFIRITGEHFDPPRRASSPTLTKALHTLLSQ